MTLVYVRYINMWVQIISRLCVYLQYTIFISSCPDLTLSQTTQIFLFVSSTKGQTSSRHMSLPQVSQCQYKPVSPVSISQWSHLKFKGEPHRKQIFFYISMTLSFYKLWLSLKCMLHVWHASYLTKTSWVSQMSISLHSYTIYQVLILTQDIIYSRRVFVT